MAPKAGRLHKLVGRPTQGSHHPLPPLPPMPKPPNPSGGRWLLLEYAHAWIGDTLYIACTSDVPVHLYVRWTAKRFGKHLETTYTAGLAMNWDPRFCFVEYITLEQAEPGDTLYHTFNFAGWASCRTRWWFIDGTVEGVFSPSLSAVFTAHYLDYKTADSLSHTALTDKQPGGVIDHAAGSVTRVKLSAPVARYYPSAFLVLYYPHLTASTGWRVLDLRPYLPDSAYAALVTLRIMSEGNQARTSASFLVRHPLELGVLHPCLYFFLEYANFYAADSRAQYLLRLPLTQKQDYNITINGVMTATFEMWLRGYIE